MVLTYQLRDFKENTERDKMNNELPKIKCPKCKKMTLEIHGEEITSDGHHYPLEDCINCGFSPIDFNDRGK